MAAWHGRCPETGSTMLTEEGFRQIIAGGASIGSELMRTIVIIAVCFGIILVAMNRLTKALSGNGAWGALPAMILFG